MRGKKKKEKMAKHPGLHLPPAAVMPLSNPSIFLRLAPLINHLSQKNSYFSVFLGSQNFPKHFFSLFYNLWKYARWNDWKDNISLKDTVTLFIRN